MTNFCALAIEAGTERMSLAACAGGRSLLWETKPARRETHRIYEHAKRLLLEVGADFSRLDCVAFGCGPGSFTGVRMAAAAAQAIAFARSIPVCRRSSLAVLAAGAARMLGAQLVATCLDAWMERVYLAVYRAGPGQDVTPVVPDALVDPLEYAIAGGEPFVAVGPGWLAYPPLLARHRGRITTLQPGLLPSAADLLSMAVADFGAGRTVQAHEALPEYLGHMPGMAGPLAARQGDNPETGKC